MKRYYNTCSICKRMFFSDTRHQRACADCRQERKAPAPGEPFTWDDEERQEPTPPEAA